jgi:hypothetical protein
MSLIVNRYFLEMSIRENYLQVLLLPSYVKIFESLTADQVENMLRAFRAERCVQHESLEVVKAYLSN